MTSMGAPFSWPQVIIHLWETALGYTETPRHFLVGAPFGGSRTKPVPTSVERAVWGYDCDVPKNSRKQLHVVWLRKESWTGQLEYMSANGRSSNIKKAWSVLKVVNATHLCENPLLPLFQTIASVGTNCTRYSWYAHRYPVNLHANWLPWHMELLDSAWTAVRFLPVTQAVFNDPQNSQLLRWVTVACGPPPWHLLRWRLQVSDSWWHLRSKLENPLWQKAPVTLNFQE